MLTCYINSQLVVSYVTGIYITLTYMWYLACEFYIHVEGMLHTLIAYAIFGRILIRNVVEKQVKVLLIYVIGMLPYPICIKNTFGRILVCTVVEKQVEGLDSHVFHFLGLSFSHDSVG